MRLTPPIRSRSIPYRNRPSCRMLKPSPGMIPSPELPALVLIADDDRLTRILLRQAMERDGYQVIDASTGEQCLEHYHQHHPDLILLDAMMPGMDGFACCWELSQYANRDNDTVPILMITSLDDEESVNYAFEMGATDYITKPIHWVLLGKRVRRLLQSRRAAQTIANQQAQLYTHVQLLNASLERQVAERTVQLEQALAELQHLHQAKDDFLNTVAHELRSPMSNMKLAIQMLENRMKQAREHCGVIAQANSECTRSMTYLNILRSECDREIALVNDLLDLQHLEQGHSSLQFTAINLDLWFPELLAPFVHRTQERQQRLTLELPPILPALVTDATVLQRILSELLNNACKYTPPEAAITLSVQLERVPAQSPCCLCSSSTRVLERLPRESIVPGRSPQPVWKISIRNYGITIPEAALPKIFDKFYRVPHGDPYRQGGTGLGLALVKTLIEHLSGFVQVESDSESTCFTITVPFVDCEV